MVIEWLKFQVAAGQREFMIQTDAAVWTAALAQYAGFLGKEVWLDPQAPNDVVFVIRWQNRESWKSIPADVLAQTEQEFARQMGTVAYTLIEAGEYQIRKFARSDT
jgi:uncharacterized protein (TIGR03792 family)